jgi:hypothetical protein
LTADTFEEDRDDDRSTQNDKTGSSSAASTAATSLSSVSVPAPIEPPILTEPTIESSPAEAVVLDVFAEHEMFANDLIQDLLSRAYPEEQQEIHEQDQETSENEPCVSTREPSAHSTRPEIEPQAPSTAAPSLPSPRRRITVVSVPNRDELEVYKQKLQEIQAKTSTLWEEEEFEDIRQKLIDKRRMDRESEHDVPVYWRNPSFSMASRSAVYHRRPTTRLNGINEVPQRQRSRTLPIHMQQDEGTTRLLMSAFMKAKTELELQQRQQVECIQGHRSAYLQSLEKRYRPHEL